MRSRDIPPYPPQSGQRPRQTRPHLAELEREGAARHARLVEMLAFVELARQAIQPPVKHLL